jgi:23S rRNA (uracil1939-C5)-methyltransferase
MQLKEVLATAAGRVEPSCEYFGRCGGCHYQHIAYEQQVESKRSILRETLRRVGKIDAPDDIAVVSGEPWGYRNRAQFHVAGSSIGYLERQSHKLCAITHCPISSPRVNEALAALIRMTRDSRWPRFLRSIEVFTNETDVQLNVLESDRPVAKRFFDWCAEAIPGFTAGLLDYAAAGSRFRVSGGSFFQVNRFLIDELVIAAGNAAGDRAIDLYAGVGLFAAALAKRFTQVTAVESGASAVRDLRFNVEGVEIVQSATEDFLRDQQSAPDFVLADPPRTGLGSKVVARLAELKPKAVAIVACDPATLARDLPGLLSAGYSMDRLTMIDLFPQTFHIETVAQLSLR